MLQQEQIEHAIGHKVLDAHGDPIGELKNAYVDDQTSELSFITVKTGWFGTRESFVPVRDASMRGEDVMVPYEKDQVKDAPTVAGDGFISKQDERELFAHYQLEYEAPRVESYDAPEVTAEEVVTRSEERLRPGTSRQESGRARLRKYVVTEQETVTVPVRTEKAVLETEPITEENREEATSGPTFTGEEHEVVLHEEQPVVETVAEPVERVRLKTQEGVHEETVTRNVRKERIEAEGDLERE
jgi:stress response protein YsnF